MIRNLLRRAIWLWSASIATVGWSQSAPTLVRVLDPTGVEGVAGVVLLFSSGDNHHSLAFIADAEGRVSLPHLNCDICTVTALDPTGLFFDKTFEFDGRSTSVTLTLQVRPTIDVVGNPGAMNVKIKVFGPDGEPLPNQRVIVRPVVMAFEANWAYRETTDSMGMVSAQLRPGKYVVATLIGENSWEASIEITQRTDAKKPTAVHLAAVGAIPR